MNNGTINEAFLEATDTKTRREILTAIAKHYGITTADVFDEVTHADAEWLPEYLVGSIQVATAVLMQRRGMLAVS